MVRFNNLARSLVKRHRNLWVNFPCRLFLKFFRSNKHFWVTFHSAPQDRRALVIVKVVKFSL